MSADPTILVLLYGATCRCGHATVFTAPGTDHLTPTSVYRLLYLSGWVEVAPSRWVCWRCSLASPAQRHSADYVQDQARQIDHNLSRADLAAIDKERADRREWKR